MANDGNTVLAAVVAARVPLAVVRKFLRFMMVAASEDYYSVR